MRRAGLLLRRQCGRDVPQAPSALGRVEESALPRRLALGVELRHAPRVRVRVRVRARARARARARVRVKVRVGVRVGVRVRVRVRVRGSGSG
jgi:hypothetical protein